MKEKEQSEHSHLKSNGNKLGRNIVVGIAIVILFVTIFNMLGYVFLWEWVGVVNYENIKTKTLWDWTELLLVPIVLAVGVWWLNKSEKEIELKIAEKRRLEDKMVAEQRATTEREIARDNQRQNALESYFDRMTSLLLDYDLRKSEGIRNEVRSVARTRTLAVLRNLDGKRKGQLIKFLHESELIIGVDPLIDLRGADLREVDLQGAFLLKANMSEADFQYADLRESNLKGANLWRSDLSHANLSKAHLSGAKISEAKLFDADMSQSVLGGTDLTASELNQTNLRGAIFHDPDQYNSKLRTANLYFARLDRANLKDAVISVNQLEGLQSLDNAIMMNGKKYRDWAKEQSFQLSNQLEDRENEEAV